MKIIIIGLDNSGKTTILSTASQNRQTPSQRGPSDRTQYFPLHAAIGFNMEVVQYKNLQFQVWDLGGQNSIRQYW